MKIYLASPMNQLQADAARGMPWLMSYGSWLRNKNMSQWMPSASSLLLDSGAYSELNSGVAIDQEAYVEWAKQWPWADNWAALDDIGGNTQRTLQNADRFGGFPTFHDSDCISTLPEFIGLARERGHWLGIGLVPPRQGKESWLRNVLGRIPDDIHIHGWALGLYTHLGRIDSIDSTHWWREAMKYRTQMPWLTYGETLEIAVKKVARFRRSVDDTATMPLFGGDPAPSANARREEVIALPYDDGQTVPSGPQQPSPVAPAAGREE